MLLVLVLHFVKAYNQIAVRHQLHSLELYSRVGKKGVRVKRKGEGGRGGGGMASIGDI